MQNIFLADPNRTLAMEVAHEGVFLDSNPNHFHRFLVVLAMGIWWIQRGSTSN
jgi:hypothetical protein